MNWSTKITKEKNGYIIVTMGGEESPVTRVIQEAEDTLNEEETRKAELEAFQKVIYEIADHFGIYSSKHSKYNLRITIEEHKNG